jgi:hypothetical protein
MRPSRRRTPSESRTGTGWICTLGVACGDEVQVAGARRGAHRAVPPGADPRAQQVGDPPDLLGVERLETDAGDHRQGDDEVAALDLAGGRRDDMPTGSA